MISSIFCFCDDFMDQKRSLAPFGFFIAFAFCLLLPSSRLQIGQESLAADRLNWKAEWEKTLKAARLEAQVTVFGWSRDSHLQALTEFQRFYPEIKLILISGSGSDLGGSPLLGSGSNRPHRVTRLISWPLSTPR
jgi:hypothetical protein